MRWGDETSSGPGVALAFVRVKLQLVKGGDRPCSHSVLDTTDKEIVLEKKQQSVSAWRSTASSLALDKLAVFLLKHVSNIATRHARAWDGCRFSDMLC